MSMFKSGERTSVTRSSRTRLARKRPFQSRPQLENLETRVVLSTAVTYTTVEQFNIGSYTIDEDFEKGVAFNVNHDAPNSDQLQLNAVLSTFPVMWIANSGDPSVSKWDTETNKEVARYFTHFAPAGQDGYNGPYGSHSGPAPSRTAVDRDGNVYVANRNFNGNLSAQVIKILASGGIDRNGNGVIDTSNDLNGDGNIGDAGGNYDAGEILPIADLNGNGIYEQSEITDERVAWVVEVGDPGGLGRSLAIDPNGDIWVGLYNDSEYWKIDGDTGAVLAGPIATPGHTPYGAQVDGNGILWGASLSTTLLRLDTNNPTDVTIYNHSQFGGNYGIAIANGKVYLANYSGNSYIEFDPVTETFSTPAAVKFGSRGIAVDQNGDIVVGRDSGGVFKFSHVDGSVLWEGLENTPTSDVRGVVVDSDNNVWLVLLGQNTLDKYTFASTTSVGSFGTGLAPYTYTDATGLTRFTSTNPSGRWTVVQNAGIANAEWGRIYWNTEAQGDVPVGTSIIVEARAADSEVDLANLPFVPISNDVPFSLFGQFIEVRATLNANSNLVSPVLSDITVATLAQPEPDLPPVVTSLRRYGYHQLPTDLVVTFDQPLNAAQASNPATYRIVDPGHDGRIGTRDDRVIPVRSVQYIENGAVSVVLRTSRQLNLHNAYLFVVPEQLTSARGIPLDGDQDGQPGGDYVAIVDRSRWVMPVHQAPVRPTPYQPVNQPSRHTPRKWTPVQRNLPVLTSRSVTPRSSLASFLAGRGR